MGYSYSASAPDISHTASKSSNSIVVGDNNSDDSSSSSQYESGASSHNFMQFRNLSITLSMLLDADFNPITFCPSASARDSAFAFESLMASCISSSCIF